MLVIISDLQLQPTSPWSVGLSDSCSQLAERLTELARRASWRQDNTYQPIDQIDVVLLGDVVDLTTAPQWLASPLRPWHNLQSQQAIRLVSEITHDVLNANADAIRILNNLAKNQAIQIPSAMADPLTVTTSELTPIQVQLHWMVGDTDWPLHLDTDGYATVREQWIQALGLAHPDTQPFAHDAIESPSLYDCLDRYRIVARHGDIHDPLSFSQDRDLASVNDMLRLELIRQFGDNLRDQLSEQGAEDLARRFACLDDVHPPILAAIVLEDLLDAYCPAPALKRQIKFLWDHSVDRCLELAWMRELHRTSPHDLLAGIAKSLQFSKRWDGNWILKNLTWLDKIALTHHGSLQDHAGREPMIRSRQARYAVYGHSRQVELQPLETTRHRAEPLEQVYLNAGSWRRSRLLKQRSGQNLGSVSVDPLTFLAFYEADERSGRGFEVVSVLTESLPATARRNDSKDERELPRRPHFSQPHEQRDSSNHDSSAKTQSHST